MKIVTINGVNLVKRGILKRRLYIAAPDGTAILELHFHKAKRIKK